MQEKIDMTRNVHEKNEIEMTRKKWSTPELTQVAVKDTKDGTTPTVGESPYYAQCRQSTQWDPGTC